MSGEQRTLPEVGSEVMLKSNAKRYRGGSAVVIRHEQRRNGGRSDARRWGLVVNFNGREIWVAPAELESARV
jgi:hypothetical protein